MDLFPLTEARRHVGQNRRRREALFEGQCIGERLERRSRLAEGGHAVDGAAELGAEVVARALVGQELAALVVEDDAGTGKPKLLELHGVGQILDRAVVESDDLTKIDRRFFHFVDLAELPVGHVEVGQLQSFERLDLAAQCLLVIHGSGNQIVQVNVLDVESLAHVGAAGTQKLRHLGAVTYRIKLRLDSIRPGGDLAEGKRRGEDLDENRVHDLPPVKTAP